MYIKKVVVVVLKLIYVTNVVNKKKCFLCFFIGTLRQLLGLSLNNLAIVTAEHILIKGDKFQEAAGHC